MPCTLLLFCLLFPLSSPNLAQQRGAEERREKLETVLRIQDTRTPHDGALRSLLGDPDTLVRTRATLACGSIQDTMLLGLLLRNLTDAPPAVQEAAAFAIGQTGTKLSESGRRQLGDDLLRNRLFSTVAGERLVEEIGKFGTRETLEDLMVRVGNVAPLPYSRGLTMSLARFAIRGIVTDDGVRALIRFLGTADPIPWEAAYALQRVGDHAVTRLEIERVALLRKHPDPLARMCAATLFGHLRGEPAVHEPLLQLAGFDPDWRVRVNALRSLAAAGHGKSHQDLEAFRAAFFDPNQHVAIAALAACAAAAPLGSATPGRAAVVEAVRQLAENADGGYPWQTQAEAALTLAHISGRDLLTMLRTEGIPQPRLLARLLEAVGATGDTAAAAILFAHADDERPAIRTAALTGLAGLSASAGDSVFAEAVFLTVTEAVLSTDLAVSATAATLLRKSPLRRPGAVDPLLRSLARRRIPEEIEVLQETILTLGELGDRRAVPALRKMLQQPDETVARAAASALRLLTGMDHSASIPRRALPLVTDFDFVFLESLPDTILVRIETIRGDILAEMYPRWAPFSIMSLLKLAETRGFYRGLTFHRVVPNFVIQGGDPRGDGWGGPGYTIRSEFSPLRYETGTVGLASAGKDTEGSQFFITHSPQPHLDGRYTILGRVVAGQEVVDLLQVDERIFDVVIAGLLPR